MTTHTPLKGGEVIPPIFVLLNSTAYTIIPNFMAVRYIRIVNHLGNYLVLFLVRNHPCKCGRKGLIKEREFAQDK